MMIYDDDLPDTSRVLTMFSALSMGMAYSFLANPTFIYMYCSRQSNYLNESMHLFPMHTSNISSHLFVAEKFHEG